MCGIAGAVDLTGSRGFSTARLRAMTAALAHRGPDDEQTHGEPGLALGARRLALVDLAGGRQPLSNERGDVWVAFNGELFEYPELRAELLRRGHRLATRCDTEAWAHLYEDYGVGMFVRARGQFAVSVWDRSRRTLLLGRDRVGICPLYYAESDGWLLWASEIKAILASGLVTARPDPKGIDYFFNYYSVSTVRTLFEGIATVPPGHYLQVEDGRKRLIRYWDLDFPDAGEELRRDDPGPLVEEFEHLLLQAVERRLRGDVPVASYLSGGLDSTLVLGLATRLRGGPVPSYTIGLDRAGPDERSQSSESAEALGSPLTTVTMNKADIAAAYPELIRAAEVPVLDTSAACMLRLASAVHRDGGKVVLTGEGADEAMAGYLWFKMYQRWGGFVRRHGMGVPKLLRELMLRSIGGDRAHTPRFAAVAGVRPAQQDLYDIMGQSRALLYSAGMWDRLGGYSSYDDIDSHPRFHRWNGLNQSLYVGYKVMLPGLLLSSKGDRVAMNSSVETRYPFLDDDVIAFCARLAPEYKVRGKVDKWLVRQVAARCLPPAIANRRKTMFRASLAPTFLGAARPEWVDQLLSPESLAATGYFDPRLVTRARRLRMRVGRVFTPKLLGLDITLTSLVATQLWHHIYCGGGLCDLPVWSAVPIRSAVFPPSNGAAAEPVLPATVP